MKTLKDYIVVAESVLPKKVCDSIIREYKNSDEWAPAVVGELDGVIADPNRRNCDIISISKPSSIQMNSELRKEIDTKIFDAMGKAINQYIETHQIALSGKDSGYDLLRYKKGGFYIQHVDSYIDIPRTVSCSLALNDNYEGGAWGFFDNEILVEKVPVGSIIMFPSNFVFPHQITPVTKGTRYSVVTWFN